jgi:serine acetyltransferase
MTLPAKLWLTLLIAWLRCLRVLFGIEAVNRDLLTRTRATRFVLMAFGAHISADARVHGPLVIHNADRTYTNLHVGQGAHIGRGVFLDLTCPIRIGAEAVVSMEAMLLTHADVGDRPTAARLQSKASALGIGDGAYLGARSIVLPGASIGAKAGVAAGAVVTRPGRDGEGVAGVPARPMSRGPGPA